MKILTITLLLLLATINAPVARAQAKYPPISKYLMPKDAEIALARSAAPASISDRATVKVLTKSGFEVAQQGDNGSVCIVMRGFSAPTYTPAQFREIVYDLRPNYPRTDLFHRASGSNGDALLRTAN